MPRPPLPRRLAVLGVLTVLLSAAPACSEPAAEEEPTVDYLEVNGLLMESMALSLQGKDLQRAKALAVLAMSMTEDHGELRAAAELAAAMAERARGDLDAFLRHVDAAVARMAVEDRATGVVIDAAEVRASRGDVEGARDRLRSWRGRADEEERERDADRARRAEEALPAPEVEAEPPAGDDEDTPRPRRRRAIPQYPIVLP